jgi:site-specific recombinase XerD
VQDHDDAAPARRTRAPNGRGSIYWSEADQRWHGWVTMGKRPDGRPDRRKRTGRTAAEVAEKLSDLEQERDSGLRTAPDRDGMLVSQWLDIYFTDIAPLRVSPNTLRTYRSKIERMKKLVGGHRIRALEPGHLEAMYAAMKRPPHSQSKNSIVQHHRIISRALKMAKRRRLIATNPATELDPPEGEMVETTPLDILAAQRVIRVCSCRRNGARWTLALAVGARQSEALGMRWHKLIAVCDGCGYETPMLDVPDSGCQVCGGSAWLYEVDLSWKVVQEPYTHGCADPVACAAPRHRRPCPRRCPGHHPARCADPAACTKKSHLCPEVRRPCPEDCTGHGRECPERVGGEWSFERRKGVKEGRGVAQVRVTLPEQLVTQLRAQRKAQAAERLRAGDLWQDYDLVFATPLGYPIASRVDYDDWHAVLRAAGVPQARVHDARHTAATLLLAQGVDVRTVQYILGHSTLSQTQRYTHVSQALTRDAAERMGGALWAPPRTARGGG